MEIGRGKAVFSTDFQYVKRGERFVLAGWTFKSQQNDVPVQTFKVTVNKIEYGADFDPASRALSAEPGMIAGKMKYDEPDVEEPKVPALERFAVKEDGSFEPLGPRPSWWKSNRLRLLGSVAGIAVMSIAVFYLRRSLRRPPTPSE